MNEQQENGLVALAVIGFCIILSSYGGYKFGYSYTETARLRAMQECRQNHDDTLREKIDEIKIGYEQIKPQLEKLKSKIGNDKDSE